MSSGFCGTEIQQKESHYHHQMYDGDSKNEEIILIEDDDDIKIVNEIPSANFDLRRGNRGRMLIKRLQPIPASKKLKSALRGTESRAPRVTSNSSGRQEANVWHASRRQEEKTNVVVASGPTVFSGDKDKGSITRGSLRPIVIDGSNVAMSHGAQNVFSVRGIQLTIDYFKSRGHKEIVAFLPQWRSKFHQSSDKKLLDSLESQGYVKFTPSREVDNRRINSYDDTFILVRNCESF